MYMPTAEVLFSGSSREWMMELWSISNEVRYSPVCCRHCSLYVAWGGHRFVNMEYCWQCDSDPMREYKVFLPVEMQVSMVGLTPLWSS